MSFPIICFDGGGIRGLVSAMMFEDLLENGDLKKTPAMYAGTSTGSFLAIGMASGMTARQFVEIYMTKGPVIFQPPAAPAGCSPLLALAKGLGRLLGIWKDVEAVFAARYGAQGLHETLHPHLHERTMEDLAASGARVMVNSLQLWDPPDSVNDLAPTAIRTGYWRPVAIGTGPKDRLRSMRLIDAAMASGAAPMYFPPHLPETAQHQGYFADGGIFANNPAAAAIAYAISEYDVPFEDISVLSFGTGGTTMGIPPRDIGDPDRWGGWKWLDPKGSRDGNVPAMPLLEASLSASAQACGEVASHLLKDRYIRADIALKSPYALDDWKNVQWLHDYVQQYMKYDERWAQKRAQVRASWA